VKTGNTFYQLAPNAKFSPTADLTFQESLINARLEADSGAAVDPSLLGRYTVYIKRSKNRRLPDLVTESTTTISNEMVYRSLGPEFII
jgi:hypothetical protein